MHIGGCQKTATSDCIARVFILLLLTAPFAVVQAD
jgi:hypothetical protein